MQVKYNPILERSPTENNSRLLELPIESKGTPSGVYCGLTEVQIPHDSHLLESINFPCIPYENISKIKLKCSHANEKILCLNYSVLRNVPLLIPSLADLVLSSFMSFPFSASLLL